VLDAEASAVEAPELADDLNAQLLAGTTITRGYPRAKNLLPVSRAWESLSVTEAFRCTQTQGDAPNDSKNGPEPRNRARQVRAEY